MALSVSMSAPVRYSIIISQIWTVCIDLFYKYGKIVIILQARLMLCEGKDDQADEEV